MISFFRFLGRNKLYTAIEVIGLSVAMTFIVFISYYVFTELSYDSQLEDTEDIYLLSDGVFPAGSATVLEQVEGRMPEVIDGTRMVSTDFLGGLALTATVGENTFKQQALGVDANFFDFFTFPFTSGDRDKVLTEKYAVSVSESFAAKWFPDEDPIGRTFDITIDKETIPLTVTGVFKDFKNSIFPYVDMIYRIELYEQAFPSLLYNGNGTANTFFRIAQGTDTGGLEKQILGILKHEDRNIFQGCPHTFQGDSFRGYRIQRAVYRHCGQEFHKPVHRRRGAAVGFCHAQLCVAYSGTDSFACKGNGCKEIVGRKEKWDNLPLPFGGLCTDCSGFRGRPCVDSGFRAVDGQAVRQGNRCAGEHRSLPGARSGVVRVRSIVVLGDSPGNDIFAF